MEYLETKMKRFILFLLCFLTSYLYSEDYKLVIVTEFDNEQKGLHCRNLTDVSDWDDRTGNILCISEDGKLYIQNIDSNCLYFYNNETFKLSKIIDLYSLDIDSKNENIINIDNNGYLYFNGSSACISGITPNNERKFLFSYFNTIRYIDYFYYDEESDILFVWNDKRQLSCVVNPTVKPEENNKNYKSTEETKVIIKKLNLKDKRFDINDKGELIVNGKVYYYQGKTINGVDYKINFPDSFSVYNVGNPKFYCFRELYFSNKSGFDIYNIPLNDDNTSYIESMAVHPSGDLYVLRFNESTQIHTLYRIENTWDPQWRKEWYATHDSTTNVSSTAVKTASKTTESLNVAVNKSMTVKENLRLRSSEETSSNVITTMQGNTKVKVIEIGKTETIDGIKSAWVKVEILSGKDKEGKDIKKGTTGWCFGGYLY